METQNKKEKIKSLVIDMLNQSHNTMIKDIDRAINSGALDIDNWNESDKPMIIPKIIVTTILQKESKQYEAKGTSFEKQIKKEVNNLHYFL